MDDLYTPEINANSVTDHIDATEAHDDLKVRALLHEIDGLDHNGTQKVGVPTLLGMNFQAVSVAQKLAGNGYLDSRGTPSAGLLEALTHTDQSLGTMVAELKARKLLDSTLSIITATHGQSPIDPSKRQIVNKNTIPTLVNGVQSNLLAHATQDDIALPWLTDKSRTAEVVRALSSNQGVAGIQEIYAEEALTLQFNDPLDDSRVPDVIMQPNRGVIYTSTTSTKIAERGGFSYDDTNVALLVWFAGATAQEIRFPVQTTQIAPTILKALRLDPNALEAVQLEHTPALPGL